MRQLLSILMLFLSVTAFGQKQKEVTFDFSNPSYLNLSGDGDINLNSSEFTKGQIKMSFDRLPNSFGVYYLNKNEDYNLQIFSGGRVLLTGINEAAIQSVSFTFSNFGDFSVVDKKTGKWDSNKGIWNCDGDNNDGKKHADFADFFVWIFGGFSSRLWQE